MIHSSFVDQDQDKIMAYFTRFNCLFDFQLLTAFFIVLIGQDSEKIPLTKSIHSFHSQLQIILRSFPLIMIEIKLLLP